MRALLFAALAFSASGAQIPAGTEISVRLMEKVATEVTTPQKLRAVVIAPVLIDGKIVMAAGTELTGTLSDVKAAADGQRAQMRFSFTQVSAVVASLDNSRETVAQDGLILGIDASKTYSSRIEEGISKLQSNDRLAGLAGIIQTAKQTLKVEDANPNIDFDPGVELTIRLTKPLDWHGPLNGPESALRPFPNESSLPALVNRQPFRTVSENPQRPSDITNIMFIGDEAQIRAAFTRAGWSIAEGLTVKSKLETARALIADRGYKEGPMSVLLLENRPPDMSWQKGNNTFARRHHLRIFRRPDLFNGKPVWVCSSTHDIGINFSDRDRTFIHRVDSSIDKERAKVVSDLLFTGLVKSLALVDRPDVPTELSNATGDALTTDGRMAVLLF